MMKERALGEVCAAIIESALTSGGPTLRVGGAQARPERL